ncbi:MAG TPA: hypothetical protein VET65_08325 [Candidatus Limnocylindrales bacterium]|nr:hypothetical protein [Candidatus Limnocylindrales bacterium]
MILTRRTPLARTAQTIALEHARSVAQRVPRRLAQWRLHVLDRLLDDLEQMRLDGERTLPDDVSAAIEAFARAHDPTLLQGIADRPRRDITTAQDRLFDAQGRVMLELASLGGGASWADIEEMYEQDEAA